MTNVKKLPAEIALSARDRNDAQRIIEHAVGIAAIGGMTSAVSRELAARRLREMAANYPHASELLAAIVQHLESYS
jgi:hypothetical protein